MRPSWRSTPRNSPGPSAQPEAENQPAHQGLRRVFWFVALWCLGVAGAMLLALPFRLLMRAAMH
jgi:hypothetical protein